MSEDSEDTRVFDKNQRDLQRVEDLQEKNDELRKLFVITEKIYDNYDITQEESAKYVYSGSLSLDEI